MNTIRMSPQIYHALTAGMAMYLLLHDWHVLTASNVRRLHFVARGETDCMDGAHFLWYKDLHRCHRHACSQSKLPDS